MAIPTVTFFDKDGKAVTLNADDQEAQANWRELGFAPEDELEVEVELVEPESEEVPEEAADMAAEEVAEDKEAADQAAGEVKTRPRPSRSKKKK